jgi:hypothetical protein
MDILQSLREVPGFLSFTVVFLLLAGGVQPLAFVSLLVLVIGTAITSMFPSIIGLYCTMVLMSAGFHYYEALHTSMALRWLDKARAPETLGQLMSVKAAASIVTYSGVWLVFCIVAYPRFQGRVVQNKNMIL